MNYKSLSASEKWIVKGIIVLFFIGSFMHFLYEISGKSALAALVSAVNESVWEHTKMVLLPVICWWSLYYVVKGKNSSIDPNKWFSGALTSLLLSIISIPMLFYFYTEAFGVEILAVDIAILFIAVLFGQLTGLHIYRKVKGFNWRIVPVVFAMLVAVYIVFTFYPPHIPIFRDGPTLTYGI